MTEKDLHMTKYEKIMSKLSLVWLAIALVVLPFLHYLGVPSLILMMVTALLFVVTLLKLYDNWVISVWEKSPD